MKKVVHVLKDLDVGGIQTVLLDRLRHARQVGKNETLVCIGSGEFREDFIGVRATFIKKNWPLIDFLTVWRLRKHLLRSGAEEVHAHHTSEGVAAWLATRGTNIKYVQYFHVHPDISNRRDNFALQFLAHVSDRGISPTLAQRDALEKAGYITKNIGVEHNKVDINRLAPAKDDLREKLDLDKNTQIILSIGNFYNTTRDQVSICKALPAIFQAHPDVHMVFIGDITNRYTPHSESYDTCKRICEQAGIADKVHFTGVIPHAPGYLNQCDVFVYATMGDTFGMAVVEAMLSGIPVVTNDHPVMREVTGGITPLYPTQDSEALAELVIRLLEQPESYPKDAVKKWSEQFLWKSP